MHPDNIYYRTNDKGLLEAVDVLTGLVVAIQHEHKTFDPDDTAQYSKVVTPTGETVYISKELTMKGRAPDFYKHTYSRLHADLLVQKIVEGMTPSQACSQIGLQYSVYNRWRAEHKEFADRILQAKKDRAEKLHDEVFEIADGSGDAKIRIDARKWAAEKHAPEVYGQKTKISGDASAPLTFTILTGIPPADPIDVTPTPPTETSPSGHLPAPSEGREAPQVTLEPVSEEL